MRLGDAAIGTCGPVAAVRCIGRRGLLLGHQARTYSEPNYIMLLAGAIAWATRQSGSGCD